MGGFNIRPFANLFEHIIRRGGFNIRPFANLIEHIIRRGGFNIRPFANLFGRNGIVSLFVFLAIPQ